MEEEEEEEEKEEEGGEEEELEEGGRGGGGEGRGAGRKRSKQHLINRRLGESSVYHIKVDQICW